MTITAEATQIEATPQLADAERFRHILDAQRAAFVRDGAPSIGGAAQRI